MNSVHAFTTSGIGAWFASAILVTLAVALGLLIWRLPDLRDRRPPGAVVSRESAFLFNNVLFLGITFAVLFGTLYPVLVEATTGARASVGAPWFNRVNAPIFVALLFLTGVGPALPWGGASWATVRERFAVPILAGVGVVVAAWALGVRDAAPLGILGLATFVLVVMGDEVVRGARSRARSRGEALPLAVVRLATRNRRRYGGYLAHVGICVMAVAIAVSATLGIDRTATVARGGELSLGAYTITYDRLVTERARLGSAGDRDACRADPGRAAVGADRDRPARLPQLVDRHRHAGRPHGARARTCTSPCSATTRPRTRRPFGSSSIHW